MLGGLKGLASADAGLDLWRLAAWVKPASTAVVQLSRKPPNSHRFVSGWLRPPMGGSFSPIGTSSCTVMATMPSAK